MANAGAQQYDYLLKFVMVGDGGVGKSSIIIRFIDDVFSVGNVATIGVEFKVCTLDVTGGKTVKLNVWDTAGQERYRAITKTYYRGTQGIVVVYDITNRKSYEGVPYWFNQVNKEADLNSVKLLIGNKSDLTDQRQVPTEEAEKFADEHGVTFLETSAKDAVNIEAAFRTLSEQCIQNFGMAQLEGEEFGNNSFYLNDAKPVSGGWCSSC